MTNVTITMDEETARWVRVEAAKAGKSVSRYVGELLHAQKRAAEDAAWAAGRNARLKAWEQIQSTPLRPISDNGQLPAKEELYDEMLRGHEHPRLHEG
jgi:hypothetical protein